MSLPETVEVVICGRKFNIKTDKDPEYVKSLAQKLESIVEKIRAGNSKVTFDKALIVACFYILDENESLRKRIQDLSTENKKLEEGAKILKKLAP
ncbi:cell division protein ZapA [Desulfurobacterium thermolithotrophum]|uniref:cell division protein ZapA n=1 Tax=Desulfurobacterium thermolithotrophum TaxID=64160 RepID=UPI0013D40403|nr:cell division protein ZapA [Desulfurobacterium thermolithotrophum]